MYYQLNVSRNNQHYFATAENSILGKDQAKRYYKDFLEIFPREKGFIVTVSRYTLTGEFLTQEFDRELLEDEINKMEMRGKEK